MTSEEAVAEALAVVRDEVQKADEGRGPDRPIERALLAHIDELVTQLREQREALERAHERFGQIRDDAQSGHGCEIPLAGVSRTVAIALNAEDGWRETRLTAEEPGR